MTERMENALNHIKTSVDVDPWAVEVVEKVFRGVDDAIAEIKELEETIFNMPNTDYEAFGAVHNCIDIINKHTGVKT